MGTCAKLFSGLLTGVLASAFLLFGAVKVTPKIWPEVYHHMKSEFGRYAKVHPATSIGYTIDPDKLRMQIGVIEIVSAILLLVGPRLARILSCLILASTVLGALYVHYALEEPVEKLAGFSLWLLALFIRLNLFFFMSPRKKEESTASKGATKGGAVPKKESKKTK